MHIPQFIDVQQSLRLREVWVGNVLRGDVWNLKQYEFLQSESSVRRTTLFQSDARTHRNPKCMKAARDSPHSENSRAARGRAALKFGRLDYEYWISCNITKDSMRRTVPRSMLIIWSAVQLSESESKHRFGSGNASCLIMGREKISFNIWHIL